MSAPTQLTVFVLSLCLGVAVLAIVATSLVRAWLKTPVPGPTAPTETKPPLPEVPSPEAAPFSPYQPPATIPPPLPISPAPEARGYGKVQVWLYNKFDWIWMGFIVLIFGALSISNAIASEKFDAGSISAAGLVISIILQGVLTVLTVVMVVFRVRPSAWLGLRWRQWWLVLLIGPVAVIGMWTIMLLLSLAGYAQWMEDLGVNNTQEAVRMLKEHKDPLVITLMSVAAVLVAPLCEEIVFRGYLYPATKRFAGPWVAALGTSLIFAAAHGGLAPLLPLFILALVLVAAYEFTGSIWAPMAIHFCFNASTVAIQLALRYSGIKILDNL